MGLEQESMVYYYLVARMKILASLLEYDPFL